MKDVRGLREKEEDEQGTGAGEAEEDAARKAEAFCAARMEGGGAAGSEKAGGVILDLRFVKFISPPEA